MADLFSVEFTPSLEVLFEGLLAKVDAVPDVLAEVGTAYFEDVLAPFMDDLGENPGHAITMSPEEWTSTRQYWTHLFTRNWGRGLAYQRPAPGSGLITGAWESGVRTDANSLTVRIANTNPDAAYVYGDFSETPERTQQKYHAKTGWRIMRPVVVRFFETSIQELAPKLFDTWWKKPI